VENPLTNVLSVLQNLKKLFYMGGFFQFLGILPKNEFFKLCSAKIGPFATNRIYSDSDTILPERGIQDLAH
jgi:hypothetical protein